MICGCGGNGKRKPGPPAYTYDGSGLRVMKAHASGGSCTSTVMVDMLYWRSLSGDTIAETDGSGSTTNAGYNEYIFFGGRRIAQSNPSSGSVYYDFVDHLGSTRVVTTATGTACYEVDYLPYVTENTPSGFSNTCSTRYRFTGYERDAETANGNSSGNDYAVARYYNSRLGRFMSGDPMGGSSGDPQSLNRYAYVGNNPINRTDPSGLCPKLGDLLHSTKDPYYFIMECRAVMNPYGEPGGGLGGGGGGGDMYITITTTTTTLQPTVSVSVTVIDLGSMAGGGSGGSAGTTDLPNPTIGPNVNYEGSKKQLCDNKSNHAMLVDFLPFGSSLLGGDASPSVVVPAVASMAASSSIDYAADSSRFLHWFRFNVGPAMTTTSKFLKGLGVALTVYQVASALNTGKNTYQACMAN
jgi:RHS repeat-associated protein